MEEATRHQEVEDRFRGMLASAGIPPPDESAHLRRAVVFLWYETKAFVLVDLHELPDEEDPFEGMDLSQLREDVEGDLPDFAETG